MSQPGSTEGDNMATLVVTAAPPPLPSMLNLCPDPCAETSTRPSRWRSLGKSLRQKRLREVPARNKEKGMAPRNAGKADPGNHKAPSTDKPVAQGILSDLGRRHDFGADASTGKNQ